MTQLSGAITRALLVVALLALPSLMLPTIPVEAAQLAVLLSFIVGIMVLIEYSSTSPSLLEFRYAPPYNRLKFIFLTIAIFTLSMIARGGSAPGPWSILLTQIGGVIGGWLDFPYSPVRLVLLLLPEGAAADIYGAVRTMAGVCYALSLAMMLSFVVFVRLLNWPVRHGVFNVWLNLPLFDPTGGGDVVRRLNRDASINIILGFLLPFLLPIAALMATGYFTLGALLQSQTMIWVICAWAFLPAAMIMRGIAMNRIAALITAKRRRVYAKTGTGDGDGLQVA